MSFERRYKPIGAKTELSDISKVGASADDILLFDGTDWTLTTLPPGVTDHGALTGLADNDHPQYALLTGATFTGTVVAPGGDSSDWNTAFGWGDHSTQGYLTGNQTITLSGDVTGSGTTSITTTVANDSHTHDTRYYTESEADSLLSGKADTSHGHTWGDITGTIDADTLGGLGLKSATGTPSGEQVIRSNSSGYTYLGWINTPSGTASSISRIYCSQDTFVRYMTPVNFHNAMYGGSSGNLSTRIDFDALVDAPYGISGSYGDNVGTGSNWGATIFGMGDAYSGGVAGTSYTATTYGLCYLRSNHSLANQGEGIYVRTVSATRAGIGSSGIWSISDITAFSDARVKDNVEVIPNALDKVNSMRGVTFTRNDMDDKESRHAGVIAQEIEEVLPEVVTTDKEGMKSVAYGNIVSILIEAIKELNAKITRLEDKE